ncbi:hypothetical protein B9Z19DRAFT_1126319 [Tuber borchii]|uniref:Uncharacterized protein n=1 Tax=Tuber borchii TaxID=42251 RepID=A0A2T6ZT54_TUBBO|nr:hypothetical protein B9Z19DRAFT_1126319 [Tuber borchii]
MFLQLQKASFTNSLLESQGDLWRSQTAVGVKNRSGLGLKNQLAAYKFCWLLPAVTDWDKWTFEKSFSQSTAFDYIHIHPTALHKSNHLLHQKSQWEILERFGELLREIEDCSSHETYRILAFLGTIVIQKFRTDVWTALFKFCDSEWKEDSETKKEMALKGQLPLDYDNVLSFSPSRFARIKYSNKHKLNLQERWEILFHTQDKWEEQELRKAWKDKPYRLYFEKCYTLISEACDAKTAQCWEYLLVQTQFARANFLLPSPAKHSFLQKQTQVGQVSKHEPSSLHLRRLKSQHHEKSSSTSTSRTPSELKLPMIDSDLGTRFLGPVPASSQVFASRVLLASSQLSRVLA